MQHVRAGCFHATRTQIKLCYFCNPGEPRQMGPFQALGPWNICDKCNELIFKDFED